MKKIILFFILFSLSFLSYGQIIKGTGVIYFNGVPGTTPNTATGSELAFSISEKALYRWDRDLSQWIDAATPPGILNQLWVSPNGDNATAEKGNPFRPWQDLRAALSQSTPVAELDRGNYTIDARTTAFPNIWERRVLQSDSVFISSPGYSSITTLVNASEAAFTDVITTSTATNIKLGINAPYLDMLFTNSGSFAYGIYMIGRESSVNLKFNRLVNTLGSGAGISFSRGRVNVDEILAKQIAIQIRNSVDSIGSVVTNKNRAYARVGKMLFENLTTNINGLVRFSLNSNDSLGYYRVDVGEVEYVSGTNDASFATIESNSSPYGAYIELNVGKSRMTPTGSTARGFWKQSHANYLRNCTIVVNVDDIEDNHFFQSIGEDVYYDNCKIYFNIKRGRFSNFMYDITDTRLENGTELYFNCDDCVINGDAFQVQGGAQGVTIDATSKWEVSGNYRMTGAHQLWDFLSVTSGSGRVVFKNVVAVNDGTVGIITAPAAVNVDIINMATNTLVVDPDVTERITPIIRDSNVK
jgi:hypothetical protein